MGLVESDGLNFQNQPDRTTTTASYFKKQKADISTIVLMPKPVIIIGCLVPKRTAQISYMAVLLKLMTMQEMSIGPVSAICRSANILKVTGPDILN